MEICELIPVTQDRRQWKDGGYGICALDEFGKTYFNPTVLGPFFLFIALECEGCIVEIEGKEHLLLSIPWAKEMFPELAHDLDILDSRIRRVVLGEGLEQYN
jgi:hypothetical protein